MKFFQLVFTPTKNRRLNELVGFLLLVSATLLFLALASYSPFDPSMNTAAPGPGVRPPQNFIGMAGALVADLALQSLGLAVFGIPLMLGLLGLRWWKSQAVASPLAKTLGGIALVIFTASFFSLLPWHWRWLHAVPLEGLLGRIVGDFFVHYFNLTGAYILTLSAIAIAMYVSTAFSFSTLQLWAQTRFAFFYALHERFTDWREARAKARAERELARRKQVKPVVASQMIPARRPVPAAPVPMTSAPRSVDGLSGIDRALEERLAPVAPAPAQPPTPTADKSQDIAEIEVGHRADSERKTKTTLPRAAGGFKLPSSALLHRPDEAQAVDEEELKHLAQLLVEKCAEFDVTGAVTHINPGPVVTTYEFKPEAGVKYNRVTALAEDLCLGMKAESILIERMAGKATVGIQVPNRVRETIWLREVIESQEFAGSKSKLTLAMGKDINGGLITADLAAMPHLLIAGSTGSGKSVAINAFIMSVLYKATPDQVRLILVDPKRLELGNYEGVPHLYTPIITEPKLASYALRNAVREMERRLKLLAEKSVRNILQYNALFEGQTISLFDGEQEGEHRPLPYIVIIIDELADLMMLDGKNVEESITRLAQMSRAVGIHLVLATQRPSVDVITGLIKANFPARVSFRVATKIDSRTILDANGAESLLGKGDMLYLPSGSSRVHRVHAPFVTEKEIAAVVEFWKKQASAQYDEKFLAAPKDESGKTEGGAPGEDGEENDELFEDAVRLVLEFGKASTSLLQRRLRIGYGRAAHLIDLMEREGIVGPADGPKPREILKRPDWLSEVEEALR
ncbi:MAG: DNA translocase FtsK 4TM domain-containing protein [Acidobacteriales bacterium]|nr:DNA translocase FtsK 4TM domain-containing protein [Terriglobales bacterium]